MTNDPIIATLARQVVVDERGEAAIETDDPATWARFDALSDAGSIDMELVGQCELRFTSLDESSFARELIEGADPAAQYLRARLNTIEPNQEPRSGDFVVVQLADDASLVYEIVVCGAGLPAAEPGETALFTMAADESILVLREDLTAVEPREA